MATTSVQNPPTASTESKSARKKKAKAEAAPNGNAPSPAVPTSLAKEDSSLDAKESGEHGQSEHPYIRELTKHIRNVHKKLTGMQRTETIISENPGVSLDDLIKDKKINADQKSSILKKPQLESQLATYEEQVQQYKKFDAESQTQLQKQRDELTTQHEKELEKTRADAQMLGVTNSADELRKKILILSQFLRAAAAKRTEVDQDSEENLAFEGVLLQVYGGDDRAVQAALDLIEGSEEKVVSIEGAILNVDCKSSIPRKHIQGQRRRNVPNYYFRRKLVC